MSRSSAKKMSRFGSVDHVEFRNQNYRSKRTDNSTKFAFAVMSEFMKDRGKQDVDLVSLSTEELNIILQDFKANVKAKNGEMYKKNSLLNLRQGLDRIGQVAFLIGGDFLTRADDIPNCVDTYSFPTVRTALGALYAKRSQLQPPVYNINEQFSPNVHLPWSCSFETFWKDLGEAYFPRFVKDGVCVSAACWYGHYTCQSIYYNMNVIVKQHNNRCVDRHLPSVLASDWRLAEVNITVSCICARK